MKKVRFEAFETAKMNESECHSPRPFLETRVNIENTALCYDYSKPIIFSVDPVHRFETSNSSPYPVVNRTNLDVSVSPGSTWSPSSELELSMLDATCHDSQRLPSHMNTKVFQSSSSTLKTHKEINHQDNNSLERVQPSILSSIENNRNDVPPKNMNNNSFFIKKGNLHKIQMQNVNHVHRQLSKLSLDKENNPIIKKIEIMQMGTQEATTQLDTKKTAFSSTTPRMVTNDCSCHHCVRNVPPACEVQVDQDLCEANVSRPNHVCNCMRPLPTGCSCSQCCHQSHHINPASHHINPASQHINPASQHTNPAPQHINPVSQHINTNCQSQSNCCEPKPQNMVDKKTWAIEKYEQSKNPSCTELQKQTGVKEKREPTVADLFKIIKLQNEQLQLLQEKVDKFITASNSRPPSIPIQSYATEHVALETVNSEQHKMSIGVMTSFEMVRTSTVINKEVVKQTENLQMQCNRSQISIKEVVTKAQPVNLNFLDGIAPVGKDLQGNNDKSKVPNGNYEEKTLNEQSLYNVQVDNATTPLMSPEQTLYLDVRDYSDSDPGSDDQSNVGWTYYNKVMTHVNGMLQDSDMPSSASALYRNTRQQCLQMQIDKTNVSVTKRVKFGDDPLGVHQPHIYAASTDTSLKMNQLAAKYLKNVPTPPPPPPAVAKTAAPFDMSFATRNYMERHKLLQGVPGFPKEPAHTDIPRFLDITALKQQPKLL